MAAIQWIKMFSSKYLSVWECLGAGQEGREMDAKSLHQLQ